MATKLTALQHAESVSHPEAIFAFQKANAFREQLLIARAHMIISQVIAGSLCMGILRASSTRWFALEERPRRKRTRKQRKKMKRREKRKRKSKSKGRKRK